MWISALVSVMVPLTGSLWSLMLLLATYSIGPTSFHTFITVMLCHEFGKESIATTWGFLRMVQGVFSFIHPALIGKKLKYSPIGFSLPLVWGNLWKNVVLEDLPPVSCHDTPWMGVHIVCNLFQVLALYFSTFTSSCLTSSTLLSPGRHLYAESVSFP